MRRARRDLQVFSLSFLDVICCGFGAIILLLVLTKFGEPLAIETARLDLDRLLIELEAELYEIRGETAILDRRLRSKVQQLSEEQSRIGRLRGDLSDDLLAEAGLGPEYMLLFVDEMVLVFV